MPAPLIPSKEMIERVFDDSSAIYARTGPNFFARFGSRLVAQVPLEVGARVLDIATVNGAVLLAVARRLGPDGHVTGIDLSAGMLQEAERAASAEGLVNVELRKMDADRSCTQRRGAGAGILAMDFEDSGAPMMRSKTPRPGLVVSYIPAVSCRLSCLRPMMTGDMLRRQEDLMLPPAR